MPKIIEGLELPELTTQPRPNPPEPVIFDIAEQTDLAVETYTDLGMARDRGLAREAIGQRMQSYQDALLADGYSSANDLEIFQSIELPPESFKGLALRALVDAFNRRQMEESYRYLQLWNQYSSGELNLRDFAPPKPPLESSPSDEPWGAAMAMQRSSDYAEEPGLRFVNESPKSQIQLAQAEQKSYDAAHNSSRLLVTNPADFIVLNAQRRVEGWQQKKEPGMLDPKTFTHFVQLAMKRAGVRLWLPGAGTRVGMLGLGGGYGWADPKGGTRLLVAAKTPDA